MSLKYMSMQGASCFRVLDQCRQQQWWAQIGLATTQQKFGGNAVQVTAWHIRVPATDLVVPAAAGDAAADVGAAATVASVCRQRRKDSNGDSRRLSCWQFQCCGTGGTTAMGQSQKPGISCCRSTPGGSRGQWERHKEGAPAKWCPGGRAWFWSADRPRAEHRVTGQQCAGRGCAAARWGKVMMQGSHALDEGLHVW